jgi:hypothetical protein
LSTIEKDASLGLINGQRVMFQGRPYRVVGPDRDGLSLLAIPGEDAPVKTRAAAPIEGALFPSRDEQIFSALAIRAARMCCGASIMSVCGRKDSILTKLVPILVCQTKNGKELEKLASIVR